MVICRSLPSGRAVRNHISINPTYSRSCHLSGECRTWRYSGCLDHQVVEFSLCLQKTEWEVHISISLPVCVALVKLLPLFQLQYLHIRTGFFLWNTVFPKWTYAYEALRMGMLPMLVKHMLMLL